MSSRPTHQVSLLDVVPWTVGFAHSWALRWLLLQKELAPLVLGALGGLPGEAPWSLVGDVRREEAARPRRTDLAFEATSSSGEECKIALETKVNDPFRSEQLAAYAAHGRYPVAYMPGLTGLLVSPIRGDTSGTTLLGSELIDALGDAVSHDVPLVGGYLAGVRDHAEAMAAARAAAVAGDDWSPPAHLTHRVAASGYHSAAWVGSVCGKLRSDASSLKYRSTAHDVGYYWHDSWTMVGGRDVFVELSLDYGQQRPRAHVWVKVGGGDGRLQDVFDRLRAVGPPDDESGWERCKWGRGSTRSVWKASSAGRSVLEGVRTARSAAEYLRHQQD